MTGDPETEGQQTTYLTTYECAAGHEFTVAHEDTWAPPDYGATLPEVRSCTYCGIYVDETDVTEVQETSVVENPEVPPHER